MAVDAKQSYLFLVFFNELAAFCIFYMCCWKVEEEMLNVSDLLQILQFCLICLQSKESGY